jgi:hypothetical protein
MVDNVVHILTHCQALLPDLKTHHYVCYQNHVQHATGGQQQTPGAMATPMSSFSMMYTHMRCSKFATPAISSNSVFIVDTSTSSLFMAPIEAIIVGDLRGSGARLVLSPITRFRYATTKKSLQGCIKPCIKLSIKLCTCHRNIVSQNIFSMHT